jgi:NAD(P)-dependent dehydrogenase (short-subunit alcohol dehydrogenase family)
MSEGENVPRPSKFLDRLKGKVAIVTGAGSRDVLYGTGKAISCMFAGEGAKVCLVDIDRGRAEQTLSLIVEAGGEAFAVEADVSRSDEDAAVVRATVERWGRVDILVNNVGISQGKGRLEQIEEAAWDRVLNVNLMSAVLLTRHAIPYLTTAGGSIVNIASVAALRAHGGASPYGASKAALIALTRELAVLYGRDGVRANAIAPGHIYTPMMAGGLDAKAREMRRKVAPLGIEGDAWDVAAAALFLASDEARFITGACIPVDGGVTQTAALTGHAFITE